jgi:hypothetical protein
MIGEKRYAIATHGPPLEDDARRAAIEAED